MIPGREYHWGHFDLARVENGMIKEHWDEAVINAPQPAGQLSALWDATFLLFDADSLQDHLILPNLCVFAGAGNFDLIIGECSGGEIMEWIPAVGLYLGIVRIIMQDEEANPAVSDYSIDDFVNRFSG